MGAGYETRKHSSIYLHDYRHGVDVLLLGMGCEMSEKKIFQSFKSGWLNMKSVSNSEWKSKDDLLKENKYTLAEAIFLDEDGEFHRFQNECDVLIAMGLSKDFVAYRVIKEYKEPREFWAVNKGAGWQHVPSEYSGAILFREVIDETA